MGDTHQPRALPKGLTGVLQRHLLPHLSLRGLQCFAQTCKDAKDLVVTAHQDVWRDACSGSGLPAGSFHSAAGPYSTVGQLASKHAAVKAGPAVSRILQGYASSWDYGNTGQLALQPSFSQLVSLCGEHVIVTPTDRRDRAGYARGECSGSPCGVSHFGSLWGSEQQCSPDGAHVVVVAEGASEGQAGRGLSLYALQPTPCLVATYDLVSSRKFVDWAPNSRVFSVRADEGFRLDDQEQIVFDAKVYICSVPGHDRSCNPARVCLLPEAGLSECVWSPCSKYIACHQDHQGQGFRLIFCARMGTILSKIALPSTREACYIFLDWVQFEGKACALFSMGNEHTEELQLQDVHGSDFRCKFLGAGSSQEVGYQTAAGYRLAGSSVEGRKVVLRDLTPAGLGPPVSTGGSIERSYPPLLAWCPGNSIWLAALDVEVQGDYDDGYMYVARLHIVDGRSGQVVSKSVVVESPQGITPHRLTWSSSGSALLVSLDIGPDAPHAPYEYRAKWMKVYFTFK